MWLLAAYNGRRGAHHTSAASAALGEEEAGPATARCGHPVGARGAGSRSARAQPAAHAWHRTGRLRGRPLAGSQSPGLARKVVGVPFRVAPATPGFCSNTYDPGNSGSSGGGRMRVGKGAQSFTPRNVTHIGTGGALVPSPPPSSPHPSAQPNSSASFLTTPLGTAEQLCCTGAFRAMQGRGDHEEEWMQLVQERKFQPGRGIRPLQDRYPSNPQSCGTVLRSWTCIRVQGKAQI